MFQWQIPWPGAWAVDRCSHQGQGPTCEAVVELRDPVILLGCCWWARQSRCLHVWYLSTLPFICPSFYSLRGPIWAWPPWWPLCNRLNVNKAKLKNNVPSMLGRHIVHSLFMQQVLLCLFCRPREDHIQITLKSLRLISHLYDHLLPQTRGYCPVLQCELSTGTGAFSDLR